MKVTITVTTRDFDETKRVLERQVWTCPSGVVIVGDDKPDGKLTTIEIEDE